MRLAGQTVWITGSGTRLGRAMALACAREGADVVVHYRTSRDGAEQTESEIRAMGRRTLVVQGDVGSPADVERMVGEVEVAMRGLTALVNSAATFHKADFASITEAEFFASIRTNLYGPFLLTQRALPLLRQASPGRVVNITDWAVDRPYRHYAAYMAAKGGLATLTEALARELAPEVLVNAIAPGPIMAPDNMETIVAERIAARTPTGRWGSPESVAAALVYTLESTDLCGSTITVDCGRRLG